jgi:Domain of unknown function (DUF4112)
MIHNHQSMTPRIKYRMMNSMASSMRHESPATQSVSARRIEPDARVVPSIDADLASARIVAKLLDSSFEIGGVKFGLDAVLGLVPVVGDLASLAIGMYPVVLARKHRLGKWVIMKMMANLGTDFLVGAVPVLGDAADVFFKAHLKNLRILETELEKRRAEPVVIDRR